MFLYHLPIWCFRYPSNPGRWLKIAVVEFPRLLPWHVALTCDIWTDQSIAGGCDYMTYLSQLLGNVVSDVQLSMLSEMFVGDPELLVWSLRIFLKGACTDHTHHTRNGRPRSEHTSK